jgi:hypothetical protein
MRYTFPAVLIAIVCSVTTLVAQETRPASTDADKPIHGIIRKPKPRTVEPGKQPAVVTPPVASTEAVAAAIAAAVRSVEDTTKPATTTRPARLAERRAPVRRYEVRWPSQRLAVQWDTPDERVTLSWQASGVAAEPARDEHRPEP